MYSSVSYTAGVIDANVRTRCVRRTPRRISHVSRRCDHLAVKSVTRILCVNVGGQSRW